ncbi:MAG: biotin transporter BioY [Nanoarchaeota archaeon]|nr:biotin transporter BioY [Nanoarchaeota archaeon]MBU1704774.1 biotin transporter BioY [Nanoarchaeota archaeon]
METQNKTVYELIFKTRNLFVDIAMLILSVVVLGIMANIRVPLWPVPVTLQTFGLLLIAFFFGSKKGVLSVFAYLLAGLFGFGVFTGYKSGMSAFLGPTAGYLVGFIFMVFLVGYLVEKGFATSKRKMLYAMVAGEVALFIFGLTGLSFYLGHPGLLNVLQLGLFPFLIGDALKIAVASTLFPYVYKGAESLAKSI